MHEPHIRPTVEQDGGLVVPVDAQYVTLTPARLQVLDEAKSLRPAADATGRRIEEVASRAFTAEWL